MNTLEVEGSPMNTKYPVFLNEEQRQHLEKLTSSGNMSARQIKRAQVLLKSDVRTNWSYERIMEAFDVSAVTIAKVRKTFAEQGLEVALQRKQPDREYEHALDGEGEAHLIALACSEPPTGRKHWSLRLLQGHFVKLGHGDGISYETIRRVLKKRTQALVERDVVYSTSGRQTRSASESARNISQTELRIQAEWCCGPIYALRASSR